MLRHMCTFKPRCGLTLLALRLNLSGCGWPPGVNPRKGIVRASQRWIGIPAGLLPLTPLHPSSSPAAPASVRIPRSAGVSHLCARRLSQPPAINHVIWQRLQTSRRSSFHDPFRQRIHVLVIQRLKGSRSHKDNTIF